MGTVVAVTWFKLSDEFYDHPKVMQAGNAAVGLWVRCCTYSSRHLLDGRIPMATAHLLGDRSQIERLTASGLWVLGDGEYVVPNFLNHQPTRAEVEAERTIRHSAKVEAGRLGGIASGIARRSNGQAEHKANVKQEAKQT